VNAPSLAPSSLSPSKRRPLLGYESDRNSKGNRSPSPSPSPPLPSRRKHEGTLSDPRASLRSQKMDQSPLTRYGRMTDSSRMKSQMTLNQSLSPGRIRRVNTDTNLKGLTPSHPLSTPRTSTSSRKSNNVSVSVSTDRFSPLALSPLSPCLRRKKTSGHLSDSESSFVKKRGSMSPFESGRLSPYASSTCGHVSD